MSFLTLAFAVAACSDDYHPITAEVGAAPVSTSEAESVPTRADESPRNSVHTTDTRLWELLDHGANTALVGLKAAGRPRGVWRAKQLMTTAEREGSRRAVLSLPGIAFVRDLPPLPVLELRIADSTALRRLRQLPYVDYVEPATLPKQILDEAIAEFGAQPAFLSNCKPPEAYPHNLGETEYGDKVSAMYSSYSRAHRVVPAWRRTQGDNILVAILDTGMDPQQYQFMDPAQFNPRPFDYSRTISSVRFSFYDAAVIAWSGPSYSVLAGETI
ncbi:MAG: hypothetical protein AB1941_05730 [Gemmatimonadota bacterium]